MRNLLLSNPLPVFFRSPVIASFCVMCATVSGNIVPEGAKPWPEISGDGVSAFVQGKNVWLELDESVIKAKRVTIPRLCATLRSVEWASDSESEIRIKPVSTEWAFLWKESPEGAAVIKLEFDTVPLLPADCPAAAPVGDGSVLLHAYQAETFGEKILFEPQWYKNTVGYWVVPSDYATWDLSIDEPGKFTVAVLQGCGEGQGGSDALISLRRGDAVKAELSFQTVDTGHFQNFRWVHLGELEVENAGNFELRIEAKKIAVKALFDVRMIHLVRQAE
ncbi:MAG: hypothetical protein AAGA58_17985 [Verrucomicrobiota bacterium]